VAGFQAGTWVFAAPRDGMRLLDRSTGQVVPFIGAWRREAAPSAAMGGVTVDAEARAAIDALILALRRTGVLPAT